MNCIVKQQDRCVTAPVRRLKNIFVIQMNSFFDGCLVYISILVKNEIASLSVVNKWTTVYQQGLHSHLLKCKIDTTLPQGKVIFLSLTAAGVQQWQYFWKYAPWPVYTGLLNDKQYPSHLTTLILFLHFGSSIPGGLISVTYLFLWHFFAFKHSIWLLSNSRIHNVAKATIMKLGFDVFFILNSWRP